MTEEIIATVTLVVGLVGHIALLAAGALVIGLVMYIARLPFTGKLRIARWNGFDFTLSLIRWGTLRRYQARRGEITFFDTGALFIPKYEIAVYEGSPSTNTARKLWGGSDRRAE